MRVWYVEIRRIRICLMTKWLEAIRALVHCSGYNEEGRGMMEIGIE